MGSEMCIRDRDMVMNFEDEFGIEIDADSMGTLKTIGDVVDYLTAHQN